MIAASTGAALRSSVSPAARPSITTRTFSWTPAPTESTANSGVPRGLSSRPTGCTSRSLAPMNLACFCVATTVPTTRAICIWLRYVYLVNDADDTRIGWHFGRVEGKRGFLASHEEHRLPDTCTD